MPGKNWMLVCPKFTLSQCGQVVHKTCTSPVYTPWRRDTILWELSAQLAQEQEFPTALTSRKIVEPLSLQTVSWCDHLYINGPLGWKNTRIHILQLYNTVQISTLQHGRLYETDNTLLHNLGKKLHSEIVQTHHLLASLAFTTSFVAVKNNSCLKTMETSRLQFQHLYCISSSVKSTQLFRTHWDFFLSHPGLVWDFWKKCSLPKWLEFKIHRSTWTRRPRRYIYPLSNYIVRRLDEINCVSVTRG